MSESSPGRPHSLLGSSIGLKFVMGATGVVLVGFILAHMAGNLQIYLGSDVFNHYAQTLKGTPPLLWTVRIVVLSAVLLHIASAWRLTQKNWAARPQAYASPRRYDRTSYAALFMRGSGLVVLAFIIFHLLHFTIGTIQHEHFVLHEVLRGDVWVREENVKILASVPEHMQRHDAYSMFVRGFQNPIIAGSYILANLLLGRHLSHGVASGFATLGYSKGGQRQVAERIGTTIATLVTLGNISFPIAVLAGVVHL
ncbi:MAG: succinate dehydrogenase cytochrome b subunit [Nannocystis sp.]|uniref:succinate dehydrogenase cytochrome b subunit n=1 Tax=Nannocystis sp. TaxID=1962667 RepID=UPI00242556BB|nr:succinate dehydrogenase cytochrome b subunit [Nannocystis sp.]MBK9755748.1 succinate dehydrogenase cytochrome b subunit [Nannocystis sp.]